MPLHRPGAGSLPAGCAIDGEFDGRPVPASAVDGATKVPIEVTEIGPAQTAGPIDEVPASEGHVVHTAKNLSVGGTGEDQFIGSDIGEGLHWEVLVAQLAAYEAGSQRAGPTEIGGGDIGFQDAEQRRGVGEQQALAAIEPE